MLGETPQKCQYAPEVEHLAVGRGCSVEEVALDHRQPPPLRRVSRRSVEFDAPERRGVGLEEGQEVRRGPVGSRCSECMPIVGQKHFFSILPVFGQGSWIN